MYEECLDRLSHPKMEYYRWVYENSERWNGTDSLAGKTVIVYCEQGFGDQIQFIRYIPRLKEEGCSIYLHCGESLHRLFTQFEVDGLIDRDKPDVPEHDYHLLSMSLPFYFDNPDVDFPYLKAECATDVSEVGGTKKIGIAWEGNQFHSNNDERSCPLKHFKVLSEKFPDWKLFMLQRQFNDQTLLEGAEDMEMYSSPLNDFMDTANLIEAMDLVISVDTSVMHLAGAMNKPTIGLLSARTDPRWTIDMNWYPSIEFLQQTWEHDYADPWKDVFKELVKKLGDTNE